MGNSNLIHLKLGSFIHISKGINTMASRQDIGNKAGEITGQAQVKKDELLDRASDAAHAAQNSSPNLTGQTTNFLQQTGEQVKNMAQGAAVAVKNTLGLNTNSPNKRSNTNNPSNPNTASNINNPSNPSTRI